MELCLLGKAHSCVLWAARESYSVRSLPSCVRCGVGWGCSTSWFFYMKVLQDVKVHNVVLCIGERTFVLRGIRSLWDSVKLKLGPLNCVGWGLGKCRTGRTWGTAQLTAFSSSANTMCSLLPASAGRPWPSTAAMQLKLMGTGRVNYTQRQKSLRYPTPNFQYLQIMLWDPTLKWNLRSKISALQIPS